MENKRYISSNNYWSQGFLMPTLILATLMAIAPKKLEAQTNSNSVSTTPVGFTTITASAGSGTAIRSSFISLPLLNTDNTIPSRGSVVLVKDARTLVVIPSNQGDSGQASFPAGYLSTPADPFLLQMTSGDAEGMMYLVSTTTPNTGNEITLTDPNDPSLNLSNNGVKAGDTFRLYMCDTLLSFFGTPATTGVLGGTNASTADQIVLISHGSTASYFYSTTLNRWARVSLGSPNANNTPLLPYYGIQYSRLANTPLSLMATGEVPTTRRKVKVKASGSTLLATYWPTDTTLSSSGIGSMPGWVSGTNSTNTDRAVLTMSGSLTTHIFDGANWRRVAPGRPLSNTNAIPTGGSTMLQRRQTNSVYSILEQSAPYSL
jgi:uncharacterized protein (TIGR02597 family)